MYQGSLVEADSQRLWRRTYTLAMRRVVSHVRLCGSDVLPDGAWGYGRFRAQLVWASKRLADDDVGDES